MQFLPPVHRSGCYRFLPPLPAATAILQEVRFCRYLPHLRWSADFVYALLSTGGAITVRILPLDTVYCHPVCSLRVHLIQIRYGGGLPACRSALPWMDTFCSSTTTATVPLPLHLPHLITLGADSGCYTYYLPLVLGSPGFYSSVLGYTDATCSYLPRYGDTVRLRYCLPTTAISDAGDFMHTMISCDSPHTVVVLPPHGLLPTWMNQ